MHSKVSVQLCAASAAALMWASPGPSPAQTLHDAQLEKTTAEALAAHKKADVPAAMQKVLDQQAALDRAELEKIRAVEAATQERALSELLSAAPDFSRDGPLARSIARRLTSVARVAQITPQVWVDRREKLVQVNTASDALEGALLSVVRTYREAGHTDFADCETFLIAHGGAAGADPAQPVVEQCRLIDDANAPGAAFAAAVAAVEAGGGELTDVARRLKAAKAAADSEEKARKAAAAQLKAAKAELDAAKKAPDAKAVVEARLKDLETLLGQIDQRAGLIGDGAFKPGEALAAIEFRKTNLREVIAATGSDADTPAAQLNRNIAGVIAGVVRYSLAGTTPSQATLTLALAHQTGLEAIAAAKLDSYKLQAKLLGEQREALLREIEYLALAQAALESMPAATHCGQRPLSAVSLAEVMREPACPRDVRQAAARAVSAFNMAWASGRTPARIREAQISQEDYARKLRVTDQVVRARYQMQQAALEELAAAGASGIKPGEIAALLQAIGIQAIAYGVN